MPPSKKADEVDSLWLKSGHAHTVCMTRPLGEGARPACAAASTKPSQGGLAQEILTDGAGQCVKCSNPPPRVANGTETDDPLNSDALDWVPE